MKKIKNKDTEKIDEIINLYKAGSFYGTISLKDFIKK